MSVKQAFLQELEHEAPATRRVLERVPEDKLGWKPAEKSMSLGGLATHLSNLPTWGVLTISSDEFDMNPTGDQPFVAEELTSVDGILRQFDENVQKFRAALEEADDEALAHTWTLKNAGEEVFTLPKMGVLRSMVFNHTIHHRGQLTVFLRLVGAPVPGTYGPSADETLGLQ